MPKPETMDERGPSDGHCDCEMQSINCVRSRSSAAKRMVVLAVAVALSLLIGSSDGVAQSASTFQAVGGGLTAMLSDDDPHVGLAALAGLRRKYDKGDPDFWKKIQEDALTSQGSALDTFLRKNYASNADEINTDAAGLPPLADRLQWLYGDAKLGDPGPSFYDALRNAPRLTPAAQRKLLAFRSDPLASKGATEFIVSHQDRFGDVATTILALATSSSPEDQAFVISFARARHEAVPDTLLATALASVNEKLVQSAAEYLTAEPDVVVRRLSRPIADRFAKEKDDHVWGLLLKLKSRVDPDAVVPILEAVHGDLGTFASERSAALIRAAALSGRTDAFFKQALSQMFDRTSPCSVRAAGTDFIAKRLADHAQGWTAVFAADAAAVLLTGLSDDCHSEEVSHSLNTLAQAGAFHTAEARTKFADDLIDAGPGLNIKAHEWIEGAHVACRSLKPVIPSLVAKLSRPITLFLAGLGSCLSADDDELETFSRLAAPGPNEEETGSALPLLQALGHIGGFGEAPATHIFNAVVNPDVDRQWKVAAAQTLASAGHGKEAIVLVDQLLATSDPKDALPIMESLLQAGTAPALVLTDGRTLQILPLLREADTRLAAARVLARRPESVPVDNLGTELLLSLKKDESLSAADCYDFAVLGPFKSPKLAIVVLVASRKGYQNESDASACAALLAPFDETREALLGLISVKPDSFFQGTPEMRRRRLSVLDHLWEFTTGLPEEKAVYRDAFTVIADAAAHLAPSVPYTLAGLATLDVWRTRIDEKFPDRRNDFSAEIWKRRVVLLASAVPAVFGAQLLLWMLLLAGYPNSRTIQSVILFNPLARKLLALGYLDIVLLLIPAVRRRIFGPFQESLLGELRLIDADGGGADAYYPGSGIAGLALTGIDRAISRLEADTISGRFVPQSSVTEKLAGWKGRVLLIGPSGRGKTSFIRHHLRSDRSRLPAAYLAAASCRDGVTAAIAARLGGGMSEPDLIASLVRSGRFDVYIDGLNEVEQRVRSSILDFVADNPGANIFVATQQLGVGLPNVDAFCLLPLTHDQMLAFIQSREPFLASDVPIRGESFRNAAKLFLGTIGAQGDDPRERPGEPHDIQDARAAFDATLANPMDLQVAADLISRGIEPDPFSLQQQQFALVDKKFRELTGVAFPITRFSEGVLKARLEARSPIDIEQFETETLILVTYKQVIARSIQGKDSAGITTYQFRHDKILDYYSHFAFLGESPEIRNAYVRDDRFSGVYDYLARTLPSAQAEELREYLLMTAVDTKDHRVSDRFIQHLRWRQLLGASDPAWVAEFDPPEVRRALDEFTQVTAERSSLEIRLAKLRASIDRERTVSRILAASDSSTLLQCVVDMLCDRGATDQGEATPFSRLVEYPNGQSIEVWAFASRARWSSAAPAMIEALLREPSDYRRFLVINIESGIEPSARDWTPALAWADRLQPRQMVTVTALDLLRGYRASGGEISEFWMGLEDNGETKLATE